MPRNSSVAAVAPRKIPTGQNLRMGILYSRNVRLVLGVRKMVWIYLDVGFDKESSRKKFGTGVWDVFWGPKNDKIEVD